MAQLAREIGVSAPAIFTERFSMNTRENAELTTPLLRWLGVRRVLVVTDRLHVRRASAVFAAQGFDVERLSVPVYDGHPDNTAMLVAGTRELAALAYYELRGWLETRRTETPEATTRLGAIPTFGSTMRISNPSGPIVLLGASYAGGWPIDRIADTELINKGVSGQASFEMLERFERDVTALKPRAVIIWGFINDIFRADGDAGAATQRTRDNYTRMIELARERGIEPILVTELTMRPPPSWMNTLASIVGALRGTESYQSRTNRQVMETNRWLVDLARREELLLLDFQSTLAEGGGMRRAEFTQADGSHVTPAGYASLTSYARPILETHVARTAS
jgi:lysophospholipase L1-like esterase